MLITIASNNDADANQFVNHFPEGLIIPKNAKIGVVNCSYILHEGFIVDGSNNTFELRLANQTVYATLTVPTGTYKTGDDLANAIQTTIQNWIATQSQVVQNAFPASEQTCTFTGDKITIHLIYDQTSIDPGTLNITANEGQDLNSYLVDPALIIGDTGAYRSIDTTQDITQGFVQSGEEGDMWWLVPTNKIGNEYFAIAECIIPQTDKEIRLFCKPRANISPSIAPIQVRVFTGGQIAIWESTVNSGGSPVKVNNSPNQPYVVGSKLQIRIPAVVDPSEGYIAEYFVDQNDGNLTEITCNPLGNDRYIIRASEELICGCAFFSEEVEGQLINNKSDQVASGNVNPGAGGYDIGEVCPQSGTTGTGIDCSVMITALDVNGDVDNVRIINPGSGHQVGDILNFDAQWSGADSLSVEVVTVSDSITISNAGSGYTTGAATTSGGTGNDATLTINSVGGSGEITDISVVDVGSGYAPGDILNVVKDGANGQITLGNLLVTPGPAIHGFSANLEQEPIGARPLVPFDDISAKMLTLSNLIDCDARYDANADLKIVSNDKLATNNRNNANIHIQLEDFGPIESREKGVNGKTVAVVPLGDNSNSHAGLFNNELFNIVYHKLENPEVLNNNELRVRLTDYQNNLLQNLYHPVTITLDLRPDIV
jgi:hypothetical protein